jgi:cbb3-type cytochrome oxidase subunit 3
MAEVDLERVGDVWRVLSYGVWDEHAAERELRRLAESPRGRARQRPRLAAGVSKGVLRVPSGIAVKRYRLFVGDCTVAVAIFVAIFVGIFVAIFLILSGKHWKSAQDRARARRMADARMRARLLRLNI